MKERYTRSFEVAAIIPQGDEHIIEGRAIHYNTPAFIRGEGSEGKFVEWYEVIDPQVLSNCDMRDVPLLLEHDTKDVIARTRNKSLQLENRSDGLYIKAKMTTSKGREVWESVRAGLRTSMSFAFPVEGTKKARDGTHEGVPIIRITAIKKLFDVAVVLNPAYEGAFANARSADLVDSMLHRERTKQKIMILLEE